MVTCPICDKEFQTQDTVLVENTLIISVVDTEWGALFVLRLSSEVLGDFTHHDHLKYPVTIAIYMEAVPETIHEIAQLQYL
jgi:hypothetical protein